MVDPTQKQITVFNSQRLNQRFINTHFNPLSTVMGAERIEVSQIPGTNTISEWLAGESNPVLVILYLRIENDVQYAVQLLRKFAGSRTKVGLLSSLTNTEWNIGLKECESQGPLPRPAFNLQSNCGAELFLQAVRMQLATL